jgi:hypothetical protein
VERLVYKNFENALFAILHTFPLIFTYCRYKSIIVKSWDSSVSIITRVQAGRLGFDFWQEKKRDFFLFIITHPAYQMGTGGSFTRDKVVRV